ncbi:MAG: 2-amino-4-hydroxy-6-hydroxymethyldihydropteridine diphosphokinase [Tannerella sp.]|nr:2-amino-4-hydroxy-6-hydroxymethyldihydropteridine diphosphokinase [Tannerella sp.]
MANVYLCLGSNLGDRRQQLIDAIVHLSEKAGTIPAFSSFHESPPWGYSSPRLFLNVAVHLVTPLLPVELLAVTQQIERSLGRIAKSNTDQYTDRLIDIDILLYDDAVLQTPDLIIPHPLMHERLFTLQPLAEIAPAIIHPVMHQPVSELLQSALSHAANSSNTCLL